MGCRDRKGGVPSCAWCGGKHVVALDEDGDPTCLKCVEFAAREGRDMSGGLDALFESLGFPPPATLPFAQGKTRLEQIYYVVAHGAAVAAGIAQKQTGTTKTGRKPVPVEIDGVTKTRGEWLTHFGISGSTFSARRKDGMSTVDALRTPKSASPIPAGKHFVEVDGKQVLVGKVAEERGMSRSTVLHRIAGGMSGAEALAAPNHGRGRRPASRAPQVSS